MNWRNGQIALQLAVILAVGACGDDDGNTDSGQDATTDSGQDATTDSGQDTRQDANPPPACAEGDIPALALAEVLTLPNAIFMTSAPGDDKHLYILQRNGTIRILERASGTLVETPFLSIPDIPVRSELGALGLAFDPDYETSGRFFVYTTPQGPDLNVVDEFRRSNADPLVANATPVARLMEVADRASNHNGGWIGFGPDGMLYVATGDEGASGDSFENGQNRNTLHGNILRLDIDNTAGGYAAAGNPFDDGLPQIWAYGLRNPWRCSFDRATGELYIGDVGQGAIEEIDVIAQNEGGANLGWPAYEGTMVFNEDVVPMVPEHHEPVHEYGRGDSGPTIRNGVSVTGGYVYRGSAIPALGGFYLFGDYASQDLGAIAYCDGAVSIAGRVPGVTLNQPVSFSEDQDGELYVISLGGTINRIVSP